MGFSLLASQPLIQGFVTHTNVLVIEEIHRLLRCSSKAYMHKVNYALGLNDSLTNSNADEFLMRRCHQDAGVICLVLLERTIVST